jgi:flagellar secretion chaperone FliS
MEITAMGNHASEYLEQEVKCADPGRLVELLFDRAVRDLRNANELWPDLRTSPAAIHLVVHAQCILLELQKSLNLAQGGELALHLARLYQFMQGELASATETRNDESTQKINVVADLLSSLGDAWSIMLRQQQQPQAAAGGSGIHSGAILVA